MHQESRWRSAYPLGSNRRSRAAKRRAHSEDRSDAQRRRPVARRLPCTLEVRSSSSPLFSLLISLLSPLSLACCRCCSSRGDEDWELFSFFFVLFFSFLFFPVRFFLTAAQRSPRRHSHRQQVRTRQTESAVGGRGALVAQKRDQPPRGARARSATSQPSRRGQPCGPSLLGPQSLSLSRPPPAARVAQLQRRGENCATRTHLLRAPACVRSLTPLLSRWLCIRLVARRAVRIAFD